MTRLILAAGVAALAITAPAASAPNGKGGHSVQHAKNNHGGKARKQHAQKQKARGGDDRHVQKARGGQRKAARVEHSNRGHRLASMQQAHSKQSHSKKQDHVKVRERAKVQHHDVRAQQRARVQERARVQDRRDVRRDLARRSEHFGRNNGPVVTVRDKRGERIRVRNVDVAPRIARAYGLDCPPGLAKKAVACMPPGQAKNAFVGRPLNVLRDRVTLRDLPDRLRYVYRDTPDYYYRYGDGYMYRVNRTNNLVSALMPLFGLGYNVGQPFPTAYSNYYMPSAYQPFYPNTPYSSYRYANGYVYQIDPYTGLIEDIDPMLGYGYGYGQMLPLSYSAYNVPYQYRPLYYDTASSYYRYAPGAIYQVDPTTSLVTAVAALLGRGLTVGQPLPVGYSAYNVPYQYRPTYYDTADNWYRYSNGYVYRVDPTTQLVTALVASVLT